MSARIVVNTTGPGNRKHLASLGRIYPPIDARMSFSRRQLASSVAFSAAVGIAAASTPLLPYVFAADC